MRSLPPVHIDPNTLSNTLPARFARLVAAPVDRDAAMLTFIIVVGASLGRRSRLIYNYAVTYPTLYALIVTEPSILTHWLELHSRYLSDPSPVTRSGISNAESLIHLVRDPVVRPDRVYTERGEDPEWRDTTVDSGVAEKRHLIVQRLGPQLEAKPLPQCASATP
jgi:hypothetical protein